MTKMTGFGIDGQNGEKELDFSNVRGDFEKNQTVNAIIAHIEAKGNLGNEIIAKISRLIPAN
jgi:hypothetical protein